jgi:GntR family transcriptional regulator, transcriptional repressor for pyruvate dehydrogenase complex
MALKTQKRGDLVAEQVKRWITARRLRPGDKLPKEGELQRLFSVSKGTAREALKALEVQGLVELRTGPQGGATVVEVPFDLTFQLMQNYLFFKDVSVADLYAVRLMVEPELAAGAVPHLTERDFAAMERSIEICAPTSSTEAHALEQRQEDLHFHDILADANPNVLLGFISRFINQALRRLVVVSGRASDQSYQKFGRANVEAHRRILDAARRRQARKVRELMHRHIEEAAEHVRKLEATVERRLVLNSDIESQVQPGTVVDAGAR